MDRLAELEALWAAVPLQGGFGVFDSDSMETWMGGVQQIEGVISEDAKHAEGGKGE